MGFGQDVLDRKQKKQRQMLRIWNFVVLEREVLSQKKLGSDGVVYDGLCACRMDEQNERTVWAAMGMVKVVWEWKWEEQFEPRMGCVKLRANESRTEVKTRKRKGYNRVSPNEGIV